MYLYNYPMITNHKLTHGNKSYINSKDEAEAEWRIWSRSWIFEGIWGKNESEASLKESEAEYLNEDESNLKLEDKNESEAWGQIFRDWTKLEDKPKSLLIKQRAHLERK
jgi:hypothetical protein